MRLAAPNGERGAMRDAEDAYSISALLLSSKSSRCRAEDQVHDNMRTCVTSNTKMS